MKQLLTLLCLVFYLAASSQNLINLSGTVTDETNNSPVEFASVVLKTTDSVYVTNVLTNDKGQFRFLKIGPGNFYLEISYLGYDRFFSNPFELKANMDMAIIKLKKNSTNLNEVNVTRIKNAIEFKPGKTVYTVGRDQTNIGLNALEVLKKIPGVFVDNNDNITVRGKSGIRVYIDDRPSALAVESPAEAIKFFPAGSIESIEVITNPGAKYDAAGSGAIINIKLKKEKKLGINGNASIGTGSRYEFSGVNKYNGALNANIRRNKTNVFINSSLRFDQRVTYNENNRSDSTGGELNSTTDGTTQSSNGFVKAGVDYFINDRNTFGVSYMISSSNYLNGSKSISKNNYNSPFLPATTTNSNTNGRFTSHTLNLNHILKTKHAGEEITFDITHSILQRKNRDSILTGFESPITIKQNQFSNLTGGVVSNVAQIDYSRTLKGDGKIEGGIKNSYTGNKSNFNFFNNEQSSWNFDSSRSNRFDYFENVSAGYFQYDNKYKKWEYELGLRGEYTNVNSNLTDVKQSYFNLFPDVQLSKKFEENRDISFSYSRRIDRVPFMMLSNAVSYTDRYVGTRGNPKLLPEISNSLSVDFQKAFENSNDFKISATGVSLFGSLNKNSTGYSVEIDTSNISYITYVNISRTWSYGGDVYAQLSYKKWYSATVNVSSFYSYFNKDNKGPIYNFYAQSGFKFLKKHSININGYYFTKFLTSQGYVKGNYQINAGYKYIFWKENGSLSLNVSDIFKTGRYHYFVKTQGYNVNGIYQWESRFAYLTFQYKFSKGWQGDGKKRTKKNTKDSRLDFNGGGGGLGTGK